MNTTGQCNIQIEMICVCAADGDLTPLRFRMEDEERQLQTVSIAQILVAKPIQYAGIDAILYLCKAVWNGRERLFELRYTVKTHRWTLFRVVY